jgi:hypothetical protein
MKKITQLPGTVSQKELLSELEKNLPDIIEHITIMAKIHKHKYDALIKEGFNEKQALELCMVIP